MAKKTWFTCVAGSTSGTADIAIYDEIGYWGINSVDFRDALIALGDVSQINLRVNSPGGEVFDGIAIYNMLKRHSAQVIVTVDGLAASIASLICMAGDVVEMPENSMMMVHNPMGYVQGTADDMREVSVALDKIKESMVTSYVSKTGLEAAAVNAILDAETWLTAQEALAKGFADKVIGAVKATNRFSLGRFRHPPRNALTPSEWVCGASATLDLSEVDWDEAGATERMLDAAGFNIDAPDPAKAKQGFLIWDHHNSNVKSSYKLPFADIIDGDLLAVDGGIRAAAAALPGTDGPDQSVKDEAQAVIDAYVKEDEAEAMTQQTTSGTVTNSGGTVANGGTVTNSGGTVANGGTVTNSGGTVTNQGTLGGATAAATVADPLAEERDRCAQISAACELAGYGEKASTFIDKGAKLGEVLSELRGLPRRSPTNRASRAATGEVNAHHNTSGEEDDSWKKVIDRKNAQFR